MLAWLRHTSTASPCRRLSLRTSPSRPAALSVDNKGEFLWIVNQIVCSKIALFLCVTERENRLLIPHADAGTVDRPVQGVWFLAVMVKQDGTKAILPIRL